MGRLACRTDADFEALNLPDRGIRVVDRNPEIEAQTCLTGRSNCRPEPAEHALCGRATQHPLGLMVYALTHGTKAT